MVLLGWLQAREMHRQWSEIAPKNCCETLAALTALQPLSPGGKWRGRGPSWVFNKGCAKQICLTFFSLYNGQCLVSLSWRRSTKNQHKSGLYEVVLPKILPVYNPEEVKKIWGLFRASPLCWGSYTGKGPSKWGLPGFLGYLIRFSSLI